MLRRRRRYVRALRTRGARMKRLVVVLASGLLWLGLPVTDLVAQPSTCQGQTINDNRPTDNDDFLTGTSGIDIAALGSGNDQYFASDAGDVLCGNEGDDVLGGELGPDLLNGGVGDDIVARSAERRAGKEH